MSTSDRSRRAGTPGVFAAAFVLLVLAGGAWDLAQPPLSATDEIAQATWAEAVWTGQWFQPLQATDPVEFNPDVLPQTEFTTPLVHDPAGDPFCYMAKATVPASCDRTTPHARWAPGRFGTYVAHYPVIPYLLTGWPLRLWPGVGGLYAARVATTVCSAGLVALAVALAVRRRRPLLAGACGVALTPGLLANTGVYNPLPIEACAALLMFTLLCLAIDDVRGGRRIGWGFPLAAALVANARPVSFLWVVSAIAVLVVACGPRSTLAALRRRTDRSPVLVLGGATAVSVAWYLVLGDKPNPTFPLLTPLHLPTTFGAKLSVTLATLPTLWDQMLGAIGYNEYSGPAWTRLVWGGLILGAAGMAVSSGRRAAAAAVALQSLVTLAVGVAASVAYISAMGIFWQGRYDRAMVSGVVVLSAWALSDHPILGPGLERFAPLLLPVAGLAQANALAGGLRRFAVGTTGPLLPWHWSGWSPPFGVAPVLVVGCAAVIVGYAALGQLVAGGLPVSPSLERHGGVHRQLLQPVVGDHSSHRAGLGAHHQ